MTTFYTYPVTTPRFGNNPCESNAEKTIQYCFESERASVKFNSDLINIDFSFSLNISLTESNRILIPKTLLGIENEIGNGSYGINYQIINAQPPFESQKIDFFDEIVLVEETFRDVYSLDRTLVDQEIKFYYNKDLGVIAFRVDEVLWRIK